MESEDIGTLHMHWKGLILDNSNVWYWFQLISIFFQTSIRYAPGDRLRGTLGLKRFRKQQKIEKIDIIRRGVSMRAECVNETREDLEYSQYCWKCGYEYSTICPSWWGWYELTWLLCLFHSLPSKQYGSGPLWRIQMCNKMTPFYIKYYITKTYPIICEESQVADDITLLCCI